MPRSFAVLILLTATSACAPQRPTHDEVKAQIVATVLLQCAKTPNDPPPAVIHC